MPDYKVYIPEAKAPLLYQYKEQFGKDASAGIVAFMEKALANTASIGQQNPAASSQNDIYQIYFGDIENENAFLYLFETRESAKLALKNRTDILAKKHPDIYLDVIAQFKENYPRLAKITGITK
ncbi:MAG TPA: hypothetical protein O0W87_03850 [Methanocorpusculum sp.]|nr:hypothetical protein [Methanocorpusculum sp.]